MTTTIVRNATTTAAKASNHIGVVGDRVRVEGVIRKMIGSKPIMHIVEDIDGNAFIVRRNSALGRAVGSLVAIEATVLEHRVYNDLKQTVLSSGREEIITDEHAFRRVRV